MQTRWVFPVLSCYCNGPLLLPMQLPTVSSLSAPQEDRQMQYILGILTQSEMSKKSISPDISTQRTQVLSVGWGVHQLTAPISTAHKNSAASKKIRTEREISASFWKVIYYSLGIGEVTQQLRMLASLGRGFSS